MRASLARQPATLKVAAIGFVIGILLYIAIRSRQRGVTFGRPRPPPPPPHSHRPPPRPGEEWGPPQDGYWGGEGPGDFSDERENWGLFVPRAQLPEAGKFGEKKNLVDEKEESYYGPWELDYSTLPKVFPANANHTFTFVCTYHSDLCPKRYSLYIRGPTLLTPDPLDFKHDPSNPRQISVTVAIPNPGVYTLYAWPDYDDCPEWWKNLKVPFWKAQVLGTPLSITVTPDGPPDVEESFNSCSLAEAQHLTHGRWIHRPSLAPEYQEVPWSKSYPAKTEFAFQPYNCKREYRNPRTSLAQTSKITSVAVLGDSTSRGSFCTILGRALTGNNKVSDSCVYRKDNDWLQESKSFKFHSGDLEIPFEFRFLTHQFADSFPRIKASLATRPSHIVTNLGLWMTFIPRDKYEGEIRKYLQMLHDAWPDATVIWRTTTDVSPMVNCFGMTNMYRDTMSEQRRSAMKVIAELSKEKGWEEWRVYVVDAWAMTAPRQETALDGRHWVTEDPEEARKVVGENRPRVNQAEEGVVQAIMEVLMLDDEKGVRDGRVVVAGLNEEEMKEHEAEMKRQEEEKKEKERRKKEEEAERKKNEEEAERKKKDEEAEKKKKDEEEARKKKEEEAAQKQKAQTGGRKRR